MNIFAHYKILVLTSLVKLVVLKEYFQIIINNEKII